MFLRTQRVSGHTYVQLVENTRVDGKVTQRTLHRFGRMDRLRTSGQLDAIVGGLGRFSERLVVLGAHHRGESVQSDARRIGGPLVFERLWETTGIADVVRDALADRHFGFPVERAIFLTVLHRLMAPGSDRAAERWKNDYVLPGTEGLQLHQLYRAMAWLGEVLPPREQTGATPFAPRTRKDAIEERLFATPVICFPTSRWCSSTRRRSTLKAPAARRSGTTGIRRTTDPIGNRWSSAWSSISRVGRCAGRAGPGTRRMRRVFSRSLTACARDFTSGACASWRIAG
jgi:hypothetical protein